MVWAFDGDIRGGGSNSGNQYALKINSGDFSQVAITSGDATYPLTDAELKFFLGKTLTNNTEDLKAFVTGKAFGEVTYSAANFMSTSSVNVFTCPIGVVEFLTFAGDAAASVVFGNKAGWSGSGTARGISLEVAFTDSTVSVGSLFTANLYLNPIALAKFNSSRNWTLDAGYINMQNDSPSAMSFSGFAQDPLNGTHAGSYTFNATATEGGHTAHAWSVTPDSPIGWSTLTGGHTTVRFEANKDTGTTGGSSKISITDLGLSFIFS